MATKSKNISEALLSRLAEAAFLKLWSYPNPHRILADGQKKEVCDLLVVFGRTAIIFSDKKNTYHANIDGAVAWKRWANKALIKSLKSVNGTERQIAREPSNLYEDEACTAPLSFIPDSFDKIYKVIVANGLPDDVFFEKKYCADSFAVSEDKTLTLSRDDIVHVLTDKNLGVVLSELDTITDFCEYLAEKERFIKSKNTMAYYKETDLLARYWQGVDEALVKYELKDEEDDVIIALGSGDSFVEFDEYKLRLEANKQSYMWDAFIQQTSEYLLNSQLEYTSGNADTELTLREMAAESRFDRRILSESFMEVVGKFPKPKAKGITRFNRFMVSPRDKTKCYIFLLVIGRRMTKATIRKIRAHMLLVACKGLAHILHGSRDFDRVAQINKIIGIATECPSYATARSEELVYLDFTKFSESDFIGFGQENQEMGADSFWKSGLESVQHSYAYDFIEPTYENYAKYGDYDVLLHEGEGGLQVLDKAQVMPNRKIRPNEKCPCGSGKKFKRCHGW